MIKVLKVRILPASTNFILSRNMEQLVENLICYVLLSISVGIKTLLTYIYRTIVYPSSVRSLIPLETFAAIQINWMKTFCTIYFFKTPEWSVRFLWNFVFPMDTTLLICHRVGNKTRQENVFDISSITNAESTSKQWLWWNIKEILIKYRRVFQVLFYVLWCQIDVTSNITVWHSTASSLHFVLGYFLR